MLDQIRYLMFDWGGTLAQVSRQENTGPRCVASVLDFMRSTGVFPPDDAQADLLDRFVAAKVRTETSDGDRELNTADMLDQWASARGMALPNGDWLTAATEAFWRPWIGCLDLIDGAAETLRRLAADGRVIGLVSNTSVPRVICRMELQRLGLADLLAFTVFSSEIGWRKPHDAIYQLAVDRAGGPVVDPASVLFVGDTPIADVDGPSRRGMKTALVRTGRWDGDESQLGSRPTVIVNSVADLPQKLFSERGTASIPPPQ